MRQGPRYRRGAWVWLSTALLLVGCGGDLPRVDVEAARARRPEGPPVFQPEPPPPLGNPPRMRSIFRPLVVPPSNRPAEQLPSAPPPTGPAAGNRPATPPEPRKDPQRLAMVGVTQLGDEVRVIIEDLDTGRSVSVGVGERAFGSPVLKITSDSVDLGPVSRRQTLTLGEGKPEPEPSPLGGFTNPSAVPPGSPAAAMALWPVHVKAVVERTLPREGEIRRAREEFDDGVRVYRVQKQVDGQNYEIRVAENGDITRYEHQVRPEAVPPAVRAAANGYMEGYAINPDDTPRFQSRRGESYYLIELRQINGRDEIDLRIAPNGQILGRG